MSRNKETTLMSECWVAGEAPQQLRDSAPHTSLSACESVPATVTLYDTIRGPYSDSVRECLKFEDSYLVLLMLIYKAIRRGRRQWG